MENLKQAVMQKSVAVDTSFVVGGGIVASLQEKLPDVILWMTAFLVAWRIVSAIQEAFINRIKRKLLEKELLELENKDNDPRR